MTAPDVALATAGAAATLDSAQRVGLTWRLLPATVIDSSGSVVTLTMDGDEDQQSPAQSLLEPAPITGDRVMILVVPPQGNYVVGYYGSSSERFRDGQTGTQSVTITAATSAFSTVTFATPFDVAPTVVAQVVTPGGAAIGSTVLITAVSATDFTLRVNLAAAATITLSVHWHAIPATQ